MKKLLILHIVAFICFSNTLIAQDIWQEINQTTINTAYHRVKNMLVFKDTLYINKSSGFYTPYNNDFPSSFLIRSGNGETGDLKWQDVTPSQFEFKSTTNASINAMTVTTLGTGFLYATVLEDTTEYTILPTGSPVVYRSSNGTTWNRMSDVGFDSYNADDAFDMIEYKGKIYVSSTFTSTYYSEMQSAVFSANYNEINIANWSLAHNTDASLYGNYRKFTIFKDTLYAITDSAYLFKTGNGVNWLQVTPNSGFGNPNNTSFTAIAVHNNFLYIGTSNLNEGSQVWKSSNGNSFSQITSSSLTTHTNISNPSIYSQSITDLKSYFGSLFVSFAREGDGGAGFPLAGILRSADDINFIKSTEDFNGNSDFYEALFQVYKNNIYHSSSDKVLSTGSKIYRLNLAPCSGTPYAGTISGKTSLCSLTPETTTLTVDGMSNEQGINVSWQESNDGTTWINILTGVGFDSTSYVTNSIANTVFYRAKITCANSSLFAYTNPVQINLSVAGCYCESYASGSLDSRIDSVSFNTINSVSLDECSTYTNYTNLKTSVILDSTYVLTVKAGSCDGAYDRSVKVYIDFNQNGDFYDNGEEVAVFGPTQLGNLTEVFTGAVTIPIGASYGETRMRVVLNEIDDPYYVTPCGSYGYGETEDYTINIVAPILFNAVGVTSYCAGASFAASYTTSNYENGNQFILQISNNVGSFANPVNIGSVTSTTSGLINASLPLSLTTGTYSLRVVSTNPINSSNIQTITILPNPSISGTVFSNSLPVTGGGKVLLYQYNPIYRMNINDNAVIDAGGAYSFTSVALGTYIIHAKPNENNNPGGYYPSAVLWQNATLVSATCGTSQTKNVSTTPYPASTGQGTISGGVYRGVNYGSGKTTLAGDPIPGVDVSLEQNPGGIIVASTTTSTLTGAQLGTYLFSNVASGAFDIKVDLPGIGMSSIHTATISGNQDTTHLDYFVDSNAVYIVPATVSIAEGIQMMQQTKIYPNPSADYIFVETANNKNQPIEISIYNAFGQVIYTEKTTKNKTKINIDDTFKNGVYIVKIKQEGINSQHRIIINN